MRTTLLPAALMLATTIIAGAQGHSDRRIVYFSSDRPRTVTLSHDGIGIASLTVPAGTTMAVLYTTQTEPNLSAPRFEAHGNIQVRLISARHGQPQSEAMLTAPVVIGGDNVDLVVAERR